MAKQVKMLEAQHKKVRIPGALMGGERYICAERLMAAASPGAGKEEKRALSKKMAGLAEEYGGAFRAKVAGMDRWFVTRQLMAECLAREAAAYRNATYARFGPRIRSRIRLLMDMVLLADKLSGRGFHRTDSAVSPDVDLTAAKKEPAADMAAAMAEAEKLLQEQSAPENAGGAPAPDAGTETGTAPDAGDPAGAETGPDNGPDPDAEELPEFDPSPEPCPHACGCAAAQAACGRTEPEPAPAAYLPGDIVALLDGPVRMTEEALAKIRDRMCALAVLTGVSSAYDSDTMFLMAVREVMINPYRHVKHEHWLALFGVTPDGRWTSEAETVRFGRHDHRAAASCAGVWDCGADGPADSMSMSELLANCLSRP